MRLDDYHEKEGKRVWLSVEEVDMLIDTVRSDWRKRVAATLGGKAGMRRSEIVSVTRNDFTHGPEGFVRIWEDYAKQDNYREAPIPNSLQDFVEGVTQDRAPDKPVVDVSGSSVYRWVRNAADQLLASTGDKGWSYLDVHDLRRSWGGHLLWNCGLHPWVVKEFGGWKDWQTFEEHYMGEMTPEARDRERGKIDYMGGKPATEEVVFNPRTSGARQAYGQQRSN